MRTALFSVLFLAPLAAAQSFTPAHPIPTGPMAGRPVIADMNDDGKPDVTLACGTCCGSLPKPDSGHILILLNDGKANFCRAPGDRILVGPSVRKVAVADFNGDGKPDVAAAEHDSYGITVLFNDGKAGLTTAPGSPFAAHTGSRPHTHDIAAADLNGDRHPDLITTNADDNAISVLLGDGRGNFRPAPGSPFSAMRHPYDTLAIGDVNGDSKPDIIAPLLADRSIGVYRGDGEGRFSLAPGAPYLVAERPGVVALEDINADGKPDILATHDDVGILDILLNKGDGRFEPAPSSPIKISRAVWGIATADFNGDKRPDVLLGAQNQKQLTLLLSNPAGALAEATSVALPTGAAPNYVAAADLNGDGRTDIIASNYGSGDLTILLAN